MEAQLIKDNGYKDVYKPILSENQTYTSIYSMDSIIVQPYKEIVYVLPYKLIWDNKYSIIVEKSPSLPDTLHIKVHIPNGDNITVEICNTNINGEFVINEGDEICKLMAVYGD